MARDRYHDIVKQALINDGWVITHDPYTIEFAKDFVYIDLGAERPIAAEKDGHKIAVEIKSFLGASKFAEFERAMGQYVIYRRLLSMSEPNRLLFLAVTQETYERVFTAAAIKMLTEMEGLKVIVVESEQKKVLQWIN